MFINLIILEWYDEVIKAIGDSGNGGYYFLTLLHIDPVSDLKIYLSVNLNDLVGCEELKRIIASNEFVDRWDALPLLIDILPVNQTYLLRTHDLRNHVECVPYRPNYRWTTDVLWGEYPETLERNKLIDKFDNYFPPQAGTSMSDR